jgi:hypothetical protein
MRLAAEMTILTKTCGRCPAPCRILDVRRGNGDLSAPARQLRGGTAIGAEPDVDRVRIGRDPGSDVAVDSLSRDPS